MAQSENVSRGMPRSLIYAAIPIGFALLVGLFILMGREQDPPPVTPTADTAPTEASPSPLDTGQVVDPNVEVLPVENELRFEPASDAQGVYETTPSGPEGRDDAVIFEDESRTAPAND